MEHETTEMQEFKETALQSKEKEIIESYKLTFSRCNYSIWERRIIYNILRAEELQKPLKERINNTIETGVTKQVANLFGDMFFNMPLHELTENANDYKNIKEALKRLLTRPFYYEDETGNFYGTTFIMKPKIIRNNSNVSFYVDKCVYEMLQSIEKGFRRFNFNIIMSLKSIYAMRFYEMFCYQDKNINGGIFYYKISYLRDVFLLNNKYSTNNRFIEKVIKTAKKELDNLANFSFNFKPMKSSGSRSFDIIEFRVYHIPENEKNTGEELEKNRTLNKWAKYARISEMLYNALQDMGFSTAEIHSNIYTLFICEQTFIKNAEFETFGTVNLLKKIDEIRQRGLKKGAENINGYIINALKSEEKIVNEKMRDLKLQQLITEKENETRK